MSVNFTPSMGSIKDMKPFKFWCQKVLPTVYDDSLSYYELLCKVVQYLNDNVDNINLLNDNVTNLYNAYVALQDYVNNYFDQNFPELVSDKLDEMAEDGTLTALIKAYIDPYFEEKSDEIDEAISAQNAEISEAIENQNASIDLLDTQMTQFIADHAGLVTETVLWSGTGSGAGFLFNLSDDPTNYNYIDVHYQFTSMSTGTKQTYEGGVRRYNSQDFANSKCMLTIPIANGNTSDIGVSTVLIKKHSVGENRYELDICDKVTTDVNGFQLEVVTSGSGGVSANDPSCGGITKIVGIKNSQDDQEIINARIGADNTVYSTLGDAIRTQIIDLKSEISSLEAIPYEVKLAMDNLFAKSAYSDNDVANDYATFHAWAMAINLLSISAVFDQGQNVIYDTDSLETLKQYLTVIAYYDNNTSSVVTDYTLNGSLTEGTSTITVSYGDKTATFNVEVSTWTLEWDYTYGALPSTNDWNVSETGQQGHTVSFESGKGLKWYGKGGGYTLVPKNYQTTANGAIEIVVNFETLTDTAQIRATLSDSSCIIGFLTQAGVRINGGAYTPIAGTALSVNTDYTLRVVRENTLGKVYLNGTLIYNGELRELSGTNNVLISTSAESQTNYTAYIKSIKFRHN
jgi:hypothetical protein